MNADNKTTRLTSRSLRTCVKMYRIVRGRICQQVVAAGKLTAACNYKPGSRWLTSCGLRPAVCSSNLYNQQISSNFHVHGRALATDVHTAAAGESRHRFQAETKKLLDIVAHSLYTDKEVFLRELISNASDALEKRRQLELSATDADAAGSEQQEGRKVEITVDETSRTMIIKDTGVGMTKEELVKNLGTIAQSGTSEYVKQAKANAEQQQQQQQQDAAESLIGQFGVGFYSAFMVADCVEVYTRSAADPSTVYRWTFRTSEDTYSIEELSEEEGRQHPVGTAVHIHLRESCKEFSNASHVQQIVSKYSSFINYPLHVQGQQVNAVQPLWVRSPSQITAEEHESFYKWISHTEDKPMNHLQFSTDSPLQVKALLYTPESHTEQFGMFRMQPGVNLYSRKVLVQSNSEALLPSWLRYIRGVVDCEDVPLHISREQAQDSKLLKQLQNALTAKVVKWYNEMATQHPDEYLKFWHSFGSFLKEGIYSDATYRDKLSPLMRFPSTKTEGTEVTSLDDYIGRMPTTQSYIYYQTAPDRVAAMSSPYVEAFLEKDHEVLLLLDPIDEMVVQALNTYKSKQFQACAQASIALEKPHDELDAVSDEEVQQLCSWMQSVLSDQVSQVVASARLKSAPALIADPENELVRRLRKHMERDGKMPSIERKHKMEINTSHPVIKGLIRAKAHDEVSAKLFAEQIFDNAQISAGNLDDPRTMLNRLNTILSTAMNNLIK